jgi:hypothetical protein
MKFSFALLLTLVFIAPQAARAQEEPGNIIMAFRSVALGDKNRYVCIPQVYSDPGNWLDLSVVASAPLEPVKRVRFQIVWPSGVSHDPGVLAFPGAVDLSEPGDDIWDIQLPECYDDYPQTYPSMYLVNYTVTSTAGTGWVCTYGDDVPNPIWTSCTGETFEAPLFDLGDDWVDGCFPFGGQFEYCAVPVQDLSWGTLKASY